MADAQEKGDAGYVEIRQRFFRTAKSNRCGVHKKGRYKNGSATNIASLSPRSTDTETGELDFYGGGGEAATKQRKKSPNRRPPLQPCSTESSRLLSLLARRRRGRRTDARCAKQKSVRPSNLQKSNPSIFFCRGGGGLLPVRNRAARRPLCGARRALSAQPWPCFRSCRCAVGLFWGLVSPRKGCVERRVRLLTSS